MKRTSQVSSTTSNGGTVHDASPVRPTPTMNSGFVSSGEALSYTMSQSHRGMWKRLVKKVAAWVVDNKLFVAFGIILTVWALCGDDLRLLLTHRTADPAFDAMVIFCIVFFSFEAVVSCFGKDDYFMSFFFALDLVSLVTLVLDLTVVAEAMFDSDGGDGGTNQARSSKTARAGARVGRVVRVLRLIRIVKLFKAFQTTKKRQDKAPIRTSAGEAFDNWGQEEEEANERKEGELRESLVGKKLSGRTTQRTIVLVLIMLIVVPLLSTETFSQTPAAAEYGADEVSQAYHMMRGGNGTREAYESMILKYIYYHNWFLGSVGCPRSGAACSFLQYSQLFWVGVTGEAETLSSYAESARVDPAVVAQWNAMAAEQDDMYNFGTMPEQVVEMLGSPWDTSCDMRGFPYLGISLLAEPIDGRVSRPIRCPSDLRSTEYEMFFARLATEDSLKEVCLTFFFDLRPYTREEASFNIIKTCFVCVVLCTASLLFSRDANELVLQPVEQMITKVEAIRDNPLVAMKMADDEFTREEWKRMKTERYLSSNSICQYYRRFCSHAQPEMLETVILEKTIIKLGSLLALGFGEAGTNIVSSNMSGAGAATSGVNAMIEGSRVDCVVGNLRIRNFSIATEVLQAKVMTFVNQVAEIVHGIVDQFSGAVNKNSGETFLVIWRTTGCEAEHVTKMAEMSVFALARILAAVHASPVLAAYRQHPGLQQRLRSNCRVDLTFGLHAGWAIEGAVGSEFKIDASYLSPNVSVAEGVERATQIYGVSLLIAESVVQICTKMMANKCRCIDRVKVAGSDMPMKLYTIDMDLLSLSVEAPACPRLWNPRQRFKVRQFLEAEKAERWHDEVHIADVFESNTDVRLIRQRYTLKFVHTFNMGYQNYAQGEWNVARGFLLRARELVGISEGPSTALLHFMEGQGGRPPKDWANVRDLCNGACLG
mmetsp:Transcript_25175/g.72546  ORF Transcript_25175/g.72546 Transcript_25175/m.72546 type:complete len:938 (+) Transcript_25175:134-2947(+)